MHLACAKLAIVGIQNAVAANRVLQRKRLRFELDAVLAGDLRTHVNLRRRSLVRMPELENDLGIANREAIDVRDAPAQDKGVVVQPEVGRVAKDNLPDLRPQASLAIDNKSNSGLLRRFLHQPAELAEA